MTVDRPSGSFKKPLDQTIVVGGKPNALQETEAVVEPTTSIILLGISMNCGDTRRYKNKKKLKEKVKNKFQFEWNTRVANG